MIDLAPMPVSASFSPTAAATLVVRPRQVQSRTIDTSTRYQGEKSFEEMVAEAFDGPVLRLSRRMKLLETADERHIRRGDALDLIENVRRELEEKHAVRPPGKAGIFARHFLAFAAVYALVALVWCVVV